MRWTKLWATLNRIGPRLCLTVSPVLLRNGVGLVALTTFLLAQQSFSTPQTKLLGCLR